MALKGTYEAVKQAIQDLIAPELERIKGQMAALGSKVDAVEAGLNAKIAALDSKVDAVESRLNAKIDSVEAGLNVKIAALDSKIDSVEAKLTAKIATVEARVEAVDYKVAAVGTVLRSLEKRLDETLSIRERLAALETWRAAQHS